MNDSLKTIAGGYTKREKNYNETQKLNNQNETLTKLEVKIKNRYSWLLIGLVIALVTVISFVIVYNVLSGRSFTLDVATVLSTLLAFFSIFLSSFFYFKATEQSNQFYDRSYTHTRDIANILAKMEGKFGEALKNIEGYSNRLNERFDNLPLINNNLQENVLKETEKNLQELLINIQDGNLSKDMVKQFEEKFMQIKHENIELKKELRKNHINNKYSPKKNRLNGFLLSLINEYNPLFIQSLNDDDLVELVKKELLKNDVDEVFIYDLINQNVINNELQLTSKGKDTLRVLLRTIYG